MQILFQAKGNVLFPMAPRETPVEPDGVKVLTAEQAAARFEVSEDDLRTLYEQHWGWLTPSSEPPAPTSDLPIKSKPSKRELLRRIRYPHLSEEHFDHFLHVAEDKGLNPWCEEVYAQLEHNPTTGLPDIKIVISLQGLRGLAHATGEEAGSDPTVYEYGENKRIPERAIKTVYRLVNGQRMPYTGQALWDEHYADTENPVAYAKPHACLSARAEADALRQAFAELGGIYLPGELTKSSPKSTRRTRTDHIRALPPVNTASLVDDYTPKTWMSFERDLMDLGFGDRQKRQNLIAEFECRYPRLKQRSEEQFYALVIKAVKEDPHVYGADVESVAV